MNQFSQQTKPQKYIKSFRGFSERNALDIQNVYPPLLAFCYSSLRHKTILKILIFFSCTVCPTLSNGNIEISIRGGRTFLLHQRMTSNKIKE